MSADPSFQTLILGRERDIVLVSFEGRISDTIYRDVEFRMPADIGSSSAASGHSTLNTVPVAFIKEEEKLPSWFLQNIPQGGKELFANQANLRYSSVIIQIPSSGIHIQVHRRGLPHSSDPHDLQSCWPELL